GERPLFQRRPTAWKSLPRSAVGTPFVDKTVVSDAKQPCLEVSWRAARRPLGSRSLRARSWPGQSVSRRLIPAELELGQMGKRLQQRFLSQILGRVTVMREVIEPAVKPVPVTLHEHREGLPVAFLGAQDQNMLIVHGI